MSEFESLTEEQKTAYSILAERDYIRSQSLWDELKEFLLTTKGKVPYEAMVIHLGHIVCENTVRKILLDQEGFYIRGDKILPHLDESAKLRRVAWAQTFWIFWKSASACSVQRIRFVSVHMDKKWFHVIRTRKNNKVLTSIGLEPAEYYAQHKSYIGKCMYVVVTAFAPHDNDFTKGGIVIPVACVRVGKEVEAKKDSFKRVYR